MESSAVCLLPNAKRREIPRVSLFGVEIHAARMPAAVEQILDWVRNGTSVCRFVVTPNVDHVVTLQSHDDLIAAYADAGLVLADGQPVIWASRLAGKPLPERVAGSDLVPALFDACQTGAATDLGRRLRVFLLGAAPGVADRAAVRIEQQWPQVEVCGVFSPPLGFERDEEENLRILAAIERAEADLVLVGLGAPKQELWVHRHRGQIRASAALCIGATIDFLAGERLRAPRWMRRMGMEWLHRLCSEPRRLARRYVKDAWLFPRLVWREMRASRRAN